MKINIFLLRLSNWIKENITKKETASIFNKIPCFSKPLTGENISYLNKINIIKIYNIRKTTFFGYITNIYRWNKKTCYSNL